MGLCVFSQSLCLHVYYIYYLYTYKESEKYIPNSLNVMIYNGIIITRTLFVFFYCRLRYNNLMTNIVPNIILN